MCGVGTGLRAMTWVSMFRREFIFLMTHDEKSNLIRQKYCRSNVVALQYLV